MFDLPRNGTDEVGNVCQECISVCSQCESETVCTECREFKFLTPNSTCEAGKRPEGPERNFVALWDILTKALQKPLARPA